MKNSNFIRALKPKLQQFRESVYLLNRNPVTRFTFISVILLILIAIFAPMIIANPPTNPVDKLLPPSWQHPFGTDEMGRDLLVRVLLGTRVSISTGLIAVILAMLIGVPLGAIAGFFGGAVNELIMRITDVFLGFPPLLLAMCISAFLGPSLENATIAIALAWWPWYTRIVCGQTSSLRERPFVKAAQAIGTPSYKTIFRHIIPNCIAPVIVQASMDLGSVILTISSLSFLGLGAQAPTPEWGLTISTSRLYFLNSWWYTIFPGAAITFTVLVFSLLGDGLREIMDPRTRNG